MDQDIENIRVLQESGANYIRHYTYKNGDAIYKFMDDYNIGKSAYGKLMDAAAEGKGVMAHRLYGHHLLYDFPIKDPNHIFDFMNHILSDIFTKQGIPILPGELLEHTPLLKYCKNELVRNWNFVNGFDILAGTIAIYQGGKTLKAAINQEVSIESFEDVALSLGIGAIELAIAVSTANPLLLIGAGLQITASIRGMVNDGAIIYFRQIQKGLRVEFSMNSIKIDDSLKKVSVQHSIDKLKIESSMRDLKI